MAAAQTKKNPEQGIHDVSFSATIDPKVMNIVGNLKKECDNISLALRGVKPDQVRFGYHEIMLEDASVSLTSSIIVLTKIVGELTEIKSSIDDFDENIKKNHKEWLIKCITAVMNSSYSNINFNILGPEEKSYETCSPNMKVAIQNIAAYLVQYTPDDSHRIIRHSGKKTTLAHMVVKYINDHRQEVNDPKHEMTQINRKTPFSQLQLMVKGLLLINDEVKKSEAREEKYLNHKDKKQKSDE